MENDFYQATIPEPCQVLGVRLRPFSIGHYIILARIGSFAVDPAVKFNIEQLIQAVWVCAHSWADNLILLDHPKTILSIQRWRNILYGMRNPLVRLGIKKRREIDWLKNTELFMAYRGEMENSPTYTVTENGGKQVDLPPPLIITVSLMKNLHIPEAELMDRPWARCVWDFIAIKAMEGQVDVFDGVQLDELQAKANRVAEAMAKRMNGEH